MPTFAKKSLGQNFLINPSIVERIVDAAKVGKDDVVFEVGPGTGNLTRALAARAKRVIALEKDHRLIAELRNNLPSNVHVIEGDALRFNPTGHSLPANGYKIVANIPYYITSHFIRAVLESWPRPQLMVLMVQKEVAHRVVAKPPHMSLLALSVQLYAKAQVAMKIKRGNFRPIPAVDSAVIVIIPLLKPAEKASSILKLAKAAFAGKRKQLINSLSAYIAIPKSELAEKIEQAGVSPSARPEELSIIQWSTLVHALKTNLFQDIA